MYWYTLLASYNIFSLNAGKYFVDGADYISGNFTILFEDEKHETKLLLSAIDDNLVEYDETYTLTIQIIGHGRILAGNNKTANVTIYDDDGKLPYRPYAYIILKHLSL